MHCGKSDTSNLPARKNWVPSHFGPLGCKDVDEPKGKLVLAQHRRIEIVEVDNDESEIAQVEFSGGSQIGLSAERP